MGTIMFTLWPWPLSLTHFLKTLTLLIIFELWVLELWYFSWIFLVIRPFSGYNYFLPCDLDLVVWPIFENFNLANNFWAVRARALIFYMCIPCDKTFPWVPLFFTMWPWPSCFTYFFENFKLANNFWIASARALIFYMSIPCDKTYSLVP